MSNYSFSQPTAVRWFLGLGAPALAAWVSFALSLPPLLLQEVWEWWVHLLLPVWLLPLPYLIAFLVLVSPPRTGLAGAAATATAVVAAVLALMVVQAVLVFALWVFSMETRGKLDPIAFLFGSFLVAGAVSVLHALLRERDSRTDAAWRRIHLRGGLVAGLVLGGFAAAAWLFAIALGKEHYAEYRFAMYVLTMAAAIIGLPFIYHAIKGWQQLRGEIAAGRPQAALTSWTRIGIAVLLVYVGTGVAVNLLIRLAERLPIEELCVIAAKRDWAFGCIVT